MSDSDPGVLSDRVETAQERFQNGQGAVETGLGDPDSDAVGQLRKACRLLAAARSLRAANGYHTALVELSFGAIERSFEFFVLALSTDTIRDFDDHTKAGPRVGRRNAAERVGAADNGFQDWHTDYEVAAHGSE